jgi:hypothetical protein
MPKHTSKGAKAPKHETARVNLSLGVQEYQRLFTHALMGNRSAGEIVTALIDAHLKEWALPAKLSDRPHGSHRQTSPVSVSDSAPPPALEVAA